MKAKTTTNDAPTTNAETDYDDRPPGWVPAKDLRGMNHILWIAGEKLDDPDPVRVSRWIVRLKKEGLV